MHGENPETKTPRNQPEKKTKTNHKSRKSIDEKKENLSRRLSGQARENLVQAEQLTRTTTNIQQYIF